MTSGESSTTTARRVEAAGRFVLFLLVVFIAVLFVSAIDLWVRRLASQGGYLILVRDIAVPVGTLLATWVTLALVDRKPWGYIWMDKPAASPRKIGFGALLGLLPIAVPSGLLLLAGQLKSVPGTDGSWWATTGITFANLLPAAAGEELLLRGYLFAVMVGAVGARWTLISTSIVFGLLHLGNPGADAQSVLIVMLAGFFLGSVLLAARSLYAAIAAHFVWNWFMAAGLHTPVSGLRVSAPDYRVIDNGPDWLTGGGWGPEGGFAAALGVFVILIYLHARPLRRMES